MRKIGGMFGRSPFGPAHEHILKVLDCLGRLDALVDAATRGDQQATTAAASEIRRLELEADEIKKAMRMQMTKSIFASVSRSEVMALTKAQDDVADECDKLAYELSIRPTNFPGFLTGPIKVLTARIAAAGEPLGEVSRTLDESEGHLSAEIAANVTDKLEAVRTLIDEVDPLQDKLLHGLFARESEIAPLDVVFIMRFGERVDKVAKKIENVADVLTRLVTGDG